MLEETKHIDLHLPKGWSKSTPAELEHIAASIILCQERQDRYHPFDWSWVKLRVVLAINGIEIVSMPEKDADEDISNITYMVKRKEDKEPWPISLGHLHALCEKIDWIEDDKAAKTIFLFPYPELTFRKADGRWLMADDGGSKLSTFFATPHSRRENSQLLTIVGPPPLLDGYSWQEYRWLCDWMQEYLRVANTGGDTSDARCHFLSVLFKPKDKGTEIDASLFTDFDLIKWQVILFWWSSLMGQLAKKFPKVFKQQDVDKGRKKKDSPWDFYNRVIATIQKYVGGLSEVDVNSASYGTVLQQLEMMARDAEEMEKINRKYKK